MAKSPTIRVDGAEVRRKVQQAREMVAGRRAHLVGFEAIEIQRFVTASSRPITIEGASRAVKNFDRRNAERPETIFAGGGRGLLLVAEERVSACTRELQDDFRTQTDGHPLAVAHVPYDPKNECDSLRWLWFEQRSAHDACDPEPIAFAKVAGGNICADCRARPAARPSPKPQSEGEEICARCHRLMELVRDDRHGAPVTFEDVQESNLIAVLSADGNSLGQFFRSLSTLEALRAGSLAVTGIFQKAHTSAILRAGEPRHVAPITGGDDIKVFLPPSAALDYAVELISRVEQLASAIGDADGILAGAPEELLVVLGVGVGLLIAPFHYPASRLVDFAHELEDEAKRSHTRSSVCFAVRRTGGEFDDDARETVGGAEWPELVRRARLLHDIVPRSQRAATAAAWELLDEERDNQLLYQIARSKAWQDWYEKCGVAWRKREDALGLLQTKGVLSLAGLGRKPS